MKRRRYRAPTGVLADTFACARFPLRLTRASCAAMYRSTTGKPPPGNDAVSSADMRRCRGCDVGRAHARGEQHPDAPALPAIVPVQDVSRPYKPPRCYACGDPIPIGEPGRKGRRYYCGPACSTEAGRQMGHPSDAEWRGRA